MSAHLSKIDAAPTVPLPSATRVRFALEASWGISHLAALIAENAKKDCDHITIEALAVRVRQLGEIVMQALGDEQEEDRDLHRRLFGFWPADGDAA